MSREKSVSTQYDKKQFLVVGLIITGVLIVSGSAYLAARAIQNATTEINVTPKETTTNRLDLPTPSPIPTLLPEEIEKIADELEESFTDWGLTQDNLDELKGSGKGE